MKMKKLFTLLALVLLGITAAWGANKTIKLDFSSFGLTGTYAKKTATVGGFGFTVDQGYKGTNNCIQMNSSKGKGTLYNTTPIPGLKYVSIHIAQGSNTYTVTTGTTQNPTTNPQTGTSTASYNAITGDTYFQVKVSGATYFSSIEITYDDSVVPLEKVSTPTFNPAGGTYSSTQSVTLSCATTGASIYYTTDGREPTTASTLYNGAITVSETTTIKAIAAKEGMSNSEVASATYTINIPPAGTTSATFDATIDKGSSPLTKGDVSFSCTSGVLDNGSEYRLYKSSTTTFSVPQGYKIVKVVFTGDDSEYPISGFGETEGLTISGNNGIWQGEAQSVTFKASNKQVRATLITVYYTTPDKLYILGQVNGNDATSWDLSKGVELVKNGNRYEGTVYFTGSNSEVKEIDGNNVTQQVSYFSFARALNPSNDQRIGAGSNSDYWLTDENVITQSIGHPLWNPGQTAFRIIPGVYKLSVSLDDSKLYIERKNVTLSFSPESGTDVEAGASVQLSSNLADLIGSAATLQYNTDGGDTYSTGNIVTLSDAEGTQTINARAAVTGSTGYVATFATGEASYTTYKTYNINIAELTNGSITANPAKARAGQQVTLTVSANSGAQLSGVPTVTSVTDITDNGNGTYTFTMPASNVTVSATFTKIDYAITVTYPNGNHGTISGLPETAQSGNPISFTVNPNNKYEVTGVTASFVNNNGGTTPVNGFSQSGNTYSFNMPAFPVSIEITYSRISTSNVFELVTDATTLKAGDKIILTNGASGYVYAMGAQSNNNRSTTELRSEVKDNKVEAPEGAQVITLEGAANAWYFNVGTGYLTAASSSNNYLRTTTTNTNDNTKATISIYDKIATITFQGTNTRRYLRYNDSGWFACYGGSTDQSPVYIFRQTATGLKVEITPESGEVIGTTQVTIEANDDLAIVSYKIGDNGQMVQLDSCTATTTINGEVGETITVYGYATLEDDGETLNDETSATYTFVAPSAPSITPASCSVVDVKQNVTISSEYITTYDNAVVEYSTDGGGTWTAYSNPFDVILEGFGSSVTVLARVTVNGVQSEEASATYTRDIQPVVFSPVSGTYYYGKQSVEMFSITKGARIYYTMTDDGSEPAVPEMNQEGTYLYSSPIEDLQPGKTYKFKAVAYIGTTHSVVTDATYTIRAAQSGSYWPNIAAMNAEEDGTADKDLENPVQVVYMSTYENNGYKPEFAYIRDNSGYGLVYFGSSGVTDYDNSKKFQMGDWLAGGKVGGKVSVWSDGFHNELGSRGATVTSWPSTSVGNTPIVPETVTNAQIKAGWDGAAYDNVSYSTGVTSSNLWGHYVHLRNNTLANVADRTSSDRKHKGVMTDPTNTTLTYYDVFYKFSGHNGAPHYDQSFFDARQEKGATFDFYGIVAFFGPDIDNDDYANQPFQIVPLDILWVYQPKISGVEAGQTYTAAQTVSLDIDAVTGDDESHAVIWYKTSEMDDYAIYTGPFEVSTTTTIEAYTTKMTQYNDQMESKHVTMQVEFTTINPPVISPESHVYTITDPAINATITRDESDGLQAKVWFTTDGSDPADNNNDNRYEYTAENVASYLTGIHATTTVRAIAEVEGVYSAEAEPQTYTFVKSNGVVYDLVTNVNQLTENGVYMIVSQKYGEALSVVQNEANRGAAGVMFVDDTKQKVYGNSDAALFQLTSLTHGDDQSGIQRFLFHTGSSTTEAANGYLCVGSEDDNTLLTEAEEDALGNDVVAVTIDADGRAHLSLNYSGGSDRYVQYWNRDRYFTTYKTEVDDRAVYIYYTASTPLAVIEKSGKVRNSYTIADDLQVVWINPSKGLAWARDLVDNINAVEIPEFGEGESDYVQAAGLMNGRPWQQNNWVMLDFTAVYDNFAEKLNEVVKGTHRVIKGGTLSGEYTDNTNYTIVLSEDTDVQLSETQIPNYEPNVYCPANYGANNEGWQTSSQHDTKRYWFMTPKVMEVCTHTWSVWHVADEMHKGFYMAERNMTDYQQPINEAGLVGAYSVDMKYNTVAAPSLSEGDAYQFLSVVMLPEQRGNNAPRRAEQVTPHGVQPGSELSKSAVVYPLDLEVDEDHIITAVSQLAADRQVVSVTYCDVAGRQSSKPFDGINIVVTRYSDGTTEACKILK